LSKSKREHGYEILSLFLAYFSRKHNSHFPVGRVFFIPQKESGIVYSRLSNT